MAAGSEHDLQARGARFGAYSAGAGSDDAHGLRSGRPVGLDQDAVPAPVTVNLAVVSPLSAGTAVIEWWPSVMLSTRCFGRFVVFILLGRRAAHGDGLALG